MVIQSLIENTTCCQDFHAEHGLSLLIRTNQRVILFDSGQSGLFLDNATYMGIDLKEVDLMVLSHGHYDHGGGIYRFLQNNGSAPIYVSQSAFLDYYSGEEKYIGLDKELLKSNRLVLTRDFYEIEEGITLHSCNERPLVTAIEPFGLNKKTGKGMEPDDFLHEQYLLVEENGKRVLFSGCSHKGIMNIMSWFRPDIFVGGFHLSKLDPDGAGEEQLKEIAHALKTYETEYYTFHCTGIPQYQYLKTYLGEQIQYLSTGQKLVLEL